MSGSCPRVTVNECNDESVGKWSCHVKIGPAPRPALRMLSVAYVERASEALAVLLLLLLQRVQFSLPCVDDEAEKGSC